MSAPWAALAKIADALDAVRGVRFDDPRLAATFDDVAAIIADAKPEPNLGLATTAQLLDEIRARIEVDYYRGGGGLDYSTTAGRPESTGPAVDLFRTRPESDGIGR